MPKKIKINGEIIGSDDAWIYDWLGIEYMTPAILDKRLEEAAGEDVELYINSPGGSVWHGSEMYTSLKEYPGKTIAKITGVAASAASFMAMGADEVHIAPTGEMMIHNAATGTWGDKNDHASNYNLLKSTDEGITNAYILKTGKTRDELLDLMNKTTWMNAQEAVKNGFADLIMFDEGKVLVTNSATPSGLSPDVVQRLKNKLLEEKGMTKTEPVAAARIQTEPTTTNDDKEGEKPMNFKELQEKHPDLVNEIMTSAINAERNRIAALNDLADAPGAAPFIKEAIKNGETAGDVAMKIIKASADRVKQEGTNRQKDSETSNVANVVSKQADPAANEAAEEAESIENMVKYATELINKKGGRI
ncbi:hypothetical protein J2TS6_48900 [Paenibacillus albilobatus]|uniref:ATP-dependent Clp protease proteolytic subunit n=1 Tax=Paenibacillus albilobatus TaxID=2716884 RepID=A0A919XL38_9BACL|nr:head maturation protease, ClpP-related [Paenibacillus albilobatus]KHF33379.1 ATP-dependent Clp protease proteolytic subunit [Paenibacillus sp. P1XP2]GIO33749.1 hypothetical protein J2TS6_48900 [Paenibacillus albilobatus]